MSESPEATTGHATTGHREPRLYRALAWVGIIAGVVFTVAVLFFSAFLLGRASDGDYGWQRGPHTAQQGGCPMMRDGAMMGPGGMGPGMMRPGSPPPARPPSAVPGPPR